MKGRVAAIAIAFALGGPPALAGGNEACKPFDAAKEVGTGFSLTRATPGQYNFLKGAWSVIQSLPGDAPPGDGAQILRKDKIPGGAIIFTRGDKLACLVLPIPDRFLKLVIGVKTGKTEDGIEL